MTVPFSLPADHVHRMQRVRLALEGLSLGDALGQRFFHRPWADAHRTCEIPPGPWEYTDDTEMALGIAEVLAERGQIDQSALATVFARRYNVNPARGYGPGAHEILTAIQAGAPWRTAAQEAFGGEGSLGNGGAMRVAPLGGYFADDFAAAAAEAHKSAEVTHRHPEGIAGAIAVAVAAAWAWQRQRQGGGAAEMFAAVLAHTPAGRTRARIDHAAHLPLDHWPLHAAQTLGNGSRITATDTVAFCLWVAARHLDDFTEAFWSTVHVGGDIDTNCAIVGGIVALAVGEVGLPAGWLRRREPLLWEGDHS